MSNDKSPNKTELLVVVNGAETLVDANLNAPLRTVAEHALAQTGNTGRPLDDWEFKDQQGRPLNLARKVGEFQFAAGAVLYLTLMVGVNGTAGARRLARVRRMTRLRA
jgi:hypothetical protein